MTNRRYFYRDRDWRSFFRDLDRDRRSFYRNRELIADLNSKQRSQGDRDRKIRGSLV